MDLERVAPPINNFPGETLSFISPKFAGDLNLNYWKIQFDSKTNFESDSNTARQAIKEINISKK